MPSPRGNGVAVLVAGTLVRYFPNMDEHVIGPLARQGRTVDVYLSLSREGFSSWVDAGDGFVTHPAYVNKDPEVVMNMIAEGIRHHGGTVVVIRMPEKVLLPKNGRFFMVGC